MGLFTVFYTSGLLFMTIYFENNFKIFVKKMEKTGHPTESKNVGPINSKK